MNEIKLFSLKIDMIMKKSSNAFLSFYKYAISPYLMSQCCYAISCSEYSKFIINEKGFIFGLIYSFIRLSKCTLLPFRKFIFINKKIKLLLFVFTFFTFVSCTNFEHQGGWSDVILDPDNKSFFVTSNKGKVFNIVSNDGIPRINWSYPEEEKGTSYSNPILYKNSILSAKFDCRGKNCEGEVFEIRKSDGQVIWNKNIPSKINPKLQIFNDILIFSTLEKQNSVEDPKSSNIYLISLRDDDTKGEVVGKIPVIGEIWNGVYLNNEKIFAATLEGSLHIFDANKFGDFSNNSLDEISIDKVNFPYAINSPLFFLENRIMFSDTSGMFYSADINNLQNFNQIDLENWMISKPLFNDSKIYVFTLNGDIITIHPDKFEIIERFNTDKVIVGDPKILKLDTDEYILLPTEKEGIEIININEFDKGNSVGRYSTEEKLYSSPLIFENNLIIHTQESKLLFFKVKTRDMYYCLNLNEEKICN